MSPPTAASEVPTPAANPEGRDNLPRIPRKWRDDAIRVLHGNGYAVSGAEAYSLLRRWQRHRKADHFIPAEFLAFSLRRGDLIQQRSRRHHEWRVSS